ncbi:ubiquitin-like domain-containing protein [Tepidibacillus marianensis]|uniref:ubiquitin-like domain-containing protein n=1 Tax=Tepidibacillus marianensis TaxID=3131995 RepID=UPI0030D3E440
MGKLYQSAANPNHVVIPPFSFLKRNKWMVLFGIVFVLLLVGVGYVQGQNKELTLVVDGQTKKIETSSKDLQALLTEQKIPFKKEDKLSIPLQSRLKDGQTIRLDHANELLVNISGEKTKILTTAKTVAEVLQQQKVTLGELDKVTPTLQTQITPNTEIVITKVDRKVVQSEEVIPFSYVRKADSTLAKGKEKVMTQGKNGKVIKFFEVTYENGQEKGKN